MNIKKSVDVSNAMQDKTINELAGHLGITRVWLWHQLKINSDKYTGQIAEFYGISVNDFVNRGK